MSSWQNIQSLALFLGPLLLPRLIATYRSWASQPRSNPQNIRPLSPRSSLALTLLFLSALVAFGSTFPIFQPANVFRQTRSDLQTPTSLLLSRLAALRPLTPADERLKQVFEAGGLEARLNYLRFGPDVVLSCPFAYAPTTHSPRQKDASTALSLYALPSILLPHLLHLFLLGLCTSTTLLASSSPSAATRWRPPATIAGSVLPALELYFLFTASDPTASPARGGVSAAAPGALYWQLLLFRGLAVSALDGVLGWVLYLSCTGRAFHSPPPAAERLALVTREWERALVKLKGIGVLRNTVVRDEGLRAKAEAYWVREGEVMRDVMEEQEVLDAVRGFLGRMDLGRVEREAEGFVDGVLGGLVAGEDSAGGVGGGGGSGR